MKRAVLAVCLSSLLLFGCETGDSSQSRRTPLPAATSHAAMLSINSKDLTDTPDVRGFLDPPDPNQHSIPVRPTPAPVLRPDRAAVKSVQHVHVNANGWTSTPAPSSGNAAVVPTALPPLANPGRNVVLTFDDGPSPWTAQLIQTLDAEHVPAVMFWNTYHLQFANNRVKSLLADSPNIMVGNHTVDHPNLLWLGYNAQFHEIMDANRAIEQALGQPVRYFRPPYGNYNHTTLQILGSQHLRFVLWSDDALDWKYPYNEPAVIRNIRSELRPGAVILMHDHPDTIQELPQIIAMLKQSGYGFTTFAGGS